MATTYRATKEKRRYNRWVANETMEDFALRFTARRARNWSCARVANTALGSISFLALEAIGGAITLTYGFDIAITAIMLVGTILFLTAFPISYYAARYGVDIDLLTRGAGFGYIGSTLTSLIYASFTFIFFALEAAILALAVEFTLGVPLVIGYLLSSLVVIPLVINGFTKIIRVPGLDPAALGGAAHRPLHHARLCRLRLRGLVELHRTRSPKKPRGAGRLIMLGAAAGVVFSLIAQVGEQVDFLRFLPEPRTRSERRRWWAALIAAGPGWSVLGVLKMLAGSYLVTLALRNDVPMSEAADPTRDVPRRLLGGDILALAGPAAHLGLRDPVPAQDQHHQRLCRLDRLVQLLFPPHACASRPGRLAGVQRRHRRDADGTGCLRRAGVDAGALFATWHSPGSERWWPTSSSTSLSACSPQGIEFRRAHLYDINPVGIGAMATACLLSLSAYGGVFGELMQALSAPLALFSSFALAPAIAWWTGGRYYIARPAPKLNQSDLTCSICEYSFDAEDMTHCPFHSGPICSLCCTLDSACRDACKSDTRITSVVGHLLKDRLPGNVATALMSPLSRFLIATAAIGTGFAQLLILVRSFRYAENFDAVLSVIFCMVLIVIGVTVWMYILVNDSQHKARDEAERQTERLLIEVRAHDRTDRALQQAKEKAEAANLAKTRYMTGLSHELRTPLNSIYGFAQILEKDPSMPVHRRTAVTTIRRSSEHLAGLIEGLLDISRIEAGRLEISRDRIHLRMFLNQVTSIFEELARERNIAFALTTAGNLPEWITFDEKRLRQILINLLSNALRYTNAGSVSLHLAYRNEVAVIDVTDTGIGIAPECLLRIWEPFERGSHPSVAGSGLGLTITRLLVEILGGEIEVESTPGTGSRFRVRLMLPSVPVAGLHPPAPTATAARSLAVAGYLGARKTILVVDDDLNHLQLVEFLLAPIGFAVLLASSAEQALEMIEDIAPDLFILDIDLPGHDGWHLAQMLRDGDHRTTPIAMISGHAMDAGKPAPELKLCDAFLAKPYNLDDLLVRIGELLRLEMICSPEDPRENTDLRLLSETERASLIAHARDGRARNLSDAIDALEGSGALAGPGLARLRRASSQFDMAAVISELEAIDVAP